MPHLFWLVIVLILFFLLISIFFILVRVLERQKKTTSHGDASPTPDNDGAAAEAPYRIRDSVLSPGERAFLPALQKAVRLLAESRLLPPPTVLASIRFAEILSVGISQSENRGLWQKAQNRITSKQADFVICHPETTRPLLVVELDDQTHARTDRKDRDAFVDRSCASAGLPVLHVRAAASYDPQRLAVDLAAKLPQRT